MPDVVDSLLDEAEAAIARMRDVAIAARDLHARAELARHMRTTALKMVGQPMEEAIALVSREWMNAWGFDADGYPEIAADMIAFTRAFCTDARGATTNTQADVASAIAALDAAFRRIGTSLADQMAFRSECAHGWWGDIVPIPDEFAKLRKTQPPAQKPGEPFWSAKAPPHCGAR